MREGRRAAALLASLILVACSTTQPSPSPSPSMSGPEPTASRAGEPSDAPTPAPSPTGQPTPSQSEGPTETPTGPWPVAGGTLHVSIGADSFPLVDSEGFSALDPQADLGPLAEVLRCCLTRTLMGYSDNPGEGLRLQPDLAAAMPVVSDDGLEWTFTIRQGVQYAPPYEDRIVTAGDFVRALHRMGKACAECPSGSIGGVGYTLYDVVVGFADYYDGSAPSISGIQAPDERTFVVNVTRPNGAVGHLMGLTGISPIPPLLDDPGALLGVATGHDDSFAGFIAATGPYMLEGSEGMTVSGPPEQHVPASGFAMGEHIFLVRNPSWVAASDPLRVAYADRIEVTPAADAAAAADAVDAGTVDVMLDPAPPLEHLAAYRDDPQRASHVHATPADSQRYILLNQVVPPMDDIHVRKAVAWATNREALRVITEQSAGQLAAVARHAVPDSIIGDLLLDYDPYGTPNGAGDLERARQEMAQSRYDSDGDGVCDDPVCAGIPTLSREPPPFPELSAEVTSQMAEIGLTLDVQPASIPDFFGSLGDPAKRFGMMIDITFFKDYPGADSFFIPQFYRGSGEVGYWNPMGVNMTSDDLEMWGLPDSESTRVDPRIEQCTPLIGVAQDQCWAQFDQFVMEQLVTLLPYTILTNARTTSDRVTSFAWDRDLALPALNRIAVMEE